MKTLRTIWLRIRSLWQRPVVKREIDEELRFHLEQRTTENIAAGMSPEDAAREARKRFGNLQSIREECRETRGASFGEATLQDIRFGLRMLRKNPGFTTVAVLTLALGIGANTAIFSIADAVLLRPLPYKNADRLVMLWSTRTKDGWRGQPSPLDFVSWREESGSFETLGAVRWGSCNLTGRGEPVTLRHGQVSAGFLEMLGMAPELGRLFAAGEHRMGAARVALLGHSLWRERFGSDPRVVGQSVRLNEESFTIVGVVPDVRQYPIDDVAIWTPLEWNEAQPDDRHFLFVVGQLKNDTTVLRAQAGIGTIAGRLAKEFPESHAGYGAAVVPLRESFAGPVKPALAVLFGAVGLVLLIACANVASLLLTRASARTSELGVRLALGATRWRLVRQMLVESCLLALGGGVLGVLLAQWGIALLLGSIPEQLPVPSYFKDIGIDGLVLGFTVLLSMVTGVFFGILPALRAGGLNLNSVLKQGERTVTGGAGQYALRSVLVVAELALTLVLLAAAGLLMKNAVRLQRVDPGLKVENVLVMEISLPGAKYDTSERKVSFYQKVLEGVRALPGVRHAGLVNDLPLRGWTRFNFTIEGRPEPAPGEVPEAGERVISADYFRALGVSVRKGRDFEEREGAGTPPVVIINEALAEHYFKGEDPIGKRIHAGGPDSGAPWHSIVGVAGNVRHIGLDASAEPEVYNLCTQNPWLRMTLVVRSESEPLAMAGAVKKQIWAVDPDQSISGVASMTQVLADSLWPTRVMTYLQGIFAASALLMAAVGLYGVMAHSVVLRRHEFGVRMALGAQPNDILRLVLKQGLKLILVGLGLGLVGALALSRALAALLHEISPTDPGVFVSVALFLAAVAFVAGYLPARRAAKVDPIVALRYE